MTRERAYEIFALLKEHYPQAKMILQWGNNFELLVSIILSAQCTDLMVNKVTSILFPKFRKPRKEFQEAYEAYKAILPDRVTIQMTTPLVTHKTSESDQKDILTYDEFTELVNFAEVPLVELEQDVRSTGFYHNKAENVQNAARIVLKKFHGILPRTMRELLVIPGVGRKTANVFLGNAYHVYEGIAVDTHVKKQAYLLGFTKQTDLNKIEQDLMRLFKKEDWFTLTYLLIEHGRNKRKKKSDRKTCNDIRTCVLCHSEGP